MPAIQRERCLRHTLTLNTRHSTWFLEIQREFSVIQRDAALLGVWQKELANVVQRGTSYRAELAEVPKYLARYLGVSLRFPPGFP